ncbi:MAG: efflux RND transporter periplasmic adaptor subunit [candidate division Zixibacteria bacterium]|nr:efflux RND transporter periplasmic adaptor subunit [candidate division Zixibacteria bacterium]
MKKLIVILIVFLILLFIIFRMMTVFKERKAQTSREIVDRIIPVEVEVVKTSPYTPILNYTGEVKGIEEIDIFPKASGKLVEMKVREGDRVKKDQLLALIDRDITGMKFELVETFSPVEGVVGKVYVDKGAQVNESSGGGGGTPLAQILNLDSIKIVIQVIEKDISRVKLYQKARINLDAYPGKEFYGAVTLISPTLNNLTHTASVEITIPNLNHLLKPGMFAEVELLIGKTEKLLLIPRYALLTEAGKKKVFIVKEGKAEVRWVEVGFSDGGFAQVESGLNLGDSLVILGQSQLQSGDKVRVVEREVK